MVSNNRGYFWFTGLKGCSFAAIALTANSGSNYEAHLSGAALQNTFGKQLPGTARCGRGNQPNQRKLLETISLQNKSFWGSFISRIAGQHLTASFGHRLQPLSELWEFLWACSVCEAFFGAQLLGAASQNCFGELFWWTGLQVWGPAVGKTPFSVLCVKKKLGGSVETLAALQQHWPKAVVSYPEQPSRTISLKNRIFGVSFTKEFQGALFTSNFRGFLEPLWRPVWCFYLKVCSFVATSVDKNQGQQPGQAVGHIFQETLKNRIIGASLTSGAPVGSNFQGFRCFWNKELWEAEEKLRRALRICSSTDGQLLLRQEFLRSSCRKHLLFRSSFQELRSR